MTIHEQPAALPLDSSEQFRVLMFVHDGKGLGHLRRLTLLAEALQGDCAVLLITGHRDVSWMLSQACEFIHLPSLDSLDSITSVAWDRQPFWRNASAKGRNLRNAIVRTVVQLFKPDAIIVDYLPMGKNGELFAILDAAKKAKLYLILRGILDAQERVKASFFNPRARHLLENRYDRLLVAADREIVDVKTEYGFSPLVASKLCYTGYITRPVDSETRRKTRISRGIAPDAKWVVCSGGGGMEGEDLVEYVIELVGSFPEVYFDIVLGPKSRSRKSSTDVNKGEKIRIHRNQPELPQYHAAADVIICRGGYNSLLESASGAGRAIAVPLRGSAEQKAHVARLSRFLPLSSVSDLTLLGDELRRVLSLGPSDSTSRTLNLDGLGKCRDLIMADLSESQRARDRSTTGYSPR